MFNVLKLFVKIMFKKSALTSNKMYLFTVTKIRWLMLFKEIIIFYSENHTNRMNILCRQNVNLLEQVGHAKFIFSLDFYRPNTYVT